MQQRRGRWLLALSLSLTMLVVGGAPSLFSTLSVGEAAVIAQQEQNIPFQTLAANPEGVNALIGESPRLVLVTTPEELNRLQDLFTPEHLHQARNVNFRQALLVAFFGGARMGERLTTIERIVLRNEDLVLYVHGEPVTATLGTSSAIASPYQIVEIARSAATFGPRHLVLHTQEPLIPFPTATLPESPLSLTSPLEADPKEVIPVQANP